MAAGLGFKDFTTGEVLTAADVDGYLMQGIWVFASAAARDSAVTSPQEGNFAFLKDTNTTTYYTGSAWTNLDTTGMVNPMTTTGDTIYSSSGSTPARLGIGSTGQVLTVAGGVPSWATPASSGSLTLITPTSTANSGGTVTTSGGAVTFSGTTSVSVNGVFTSTYANYLVVVSSVVGSTDINCNLRLRASGTDTTTNYSWGQVYAPYTGGGVGGGNASASSEFIFAQASSSTEISSNIYINSPEKAEDTSISAIGASRTLLNFFAGLQTASTQFDGFTIFQNTGTQSGVIRVYGLAN